MFNWILKTIVGSKNQRELRRIQPVVRQINEIEETLGELSDDALRAKTAAWKQELSAISDSSALAARLEEILPEAFAVVKKAARRLTERRHSFTVCDQSMTWDMVHFDVQLIGGLVLHRGRIAEMATGEGKTLVATLPALPECAHRPRSSRRDGQRLPRPARRGMDGAALRFPRTNGRLHSARSAA